MSWQNFSSLSNYSSYFTNKDGIIAEAWRDQNPRIYKRDRYKTLLDIATQCINSNAAMVVREFDGRTLAVQRIITYLEEKQKTDKDFKPFIGTLESVKKQYSEQSARFETNEQARGQSEALEATRRALAEQQRLVQAKEAERALAERKAQVAREAELKAQDDRALSIARERSTQDTAQRAQREREEALNKEKAAVEVAEKAQKENSETQAQSKKLAAQTDRAIQIAKESQAHVESLQKELSEKTEEFTQKSQRYESEKKALAERLEVITKQLEEKGTNIACTAGQETVLKVTIESLKKTLVTLKIDNEHLEQFVKQKEAECLQLRAAVTHLVAEKEDLLKEKEESSAKITELASDLQKQRTVINEMKRALALNTEAIASQIAPRRNLG